MSNNLHVRGNQQVNSQKKTVDQLGKSEKHRLINTLTRFQAIECWIWLIRSLSCADNLYYEGATTKDEQDKEIACENATTDLIRR